MLGITDAYAKILTNHKIASDRFKIELSLKGEFSLPEPGQFALLKFLGGYDPLLGRPLSFFDFDCQHMIASFVYRIAGRGTALLAAKRKGETLLVFGPLGRPFHVPPDASRLVFVAGGIGAAALNMMARQYSRQTKLDYYLGAKTQQEIVGLRELEELGLRVRLTTEDGSQGTRGLITDILIRDLSQLDPSGTCIFACGPRPMLEQLGLILKGRPFSCQVSLEERMACGIGACLCCALATKDDGGKGYVRVCCEGPVFDIKDLNW